MEEFIKEYFDQDNACTAYPIYFQIQDIEWVSSYHFEDGERYSFVYDGEIVAQEETLEELFKEIRESCHDCELDFSSVLDENWISEATCQAFCEDNDYCNGIFAEKKHYKYCQMFLLKSEAESHLKDNHYHYSKEAKVYCQHAWRAPRQEKFLKDLHAFLVKEAA